MPLGYDRCTSISPTPAKSAGYGLIRYAAGSAMPAYDTLVKPSKRQALTGPQAVLALLLAPVAVSILLVGPVLLVEWFSSLGLWPFAVVAIVAMSLLFLSSLGVLTAYQRPVGPERGRSIALNQGRIVQLKDDEIVAEIDATRRYEYKILDRYDAPDALFGLYQDHQSLTFYFSDPGAREIVREAMGLAWPPRARHAGRSYAPPAA